MRRPSVVIVGSVNVDFVVRVGRLPRAGETVTGGTLERYGGGKGANAAVAAARSGAAVAFVGAVGDDDLGAWQLGELARERIDVSRIAKLTDTHTGVALITVDPLGENQIAVASGANAAVDAPLVDGALESIDPAPGAVCLLGFELADEALVVAAAWADRHGLRLIVDPAPARPIRDELLALHPLLTPNAAEALAITNEATEEAAGWVLHERSGAPVVVTFGMHGLLVVDEPGARRLPAYAVNAIDSTGAGDVFNGALAARLARGAGLDEGVNWAMAAAALSTAGPGARNAPAAEAVESFLRSR